MAKRRTLSAPSPEELAAIEKEVSDETTRRPIAPIAQVAGDAARAAEGATPEVRAERARNAADAERLRAAEAAGLILTDIRLDEIEADAMVRDRIELDEEEMAELQRSISMNGLRMPLEVFLLAEPYGEIKYGLLSGYRRLMACRALVEMGFEKYGTVKSFIRTPDGVNAAYVAMVEENEVRAALTPFERGRIAVIAAGQGAFSNVYEAVDKLYETASKGKRSKIRSFALVFEELGDMLTFPEALTEARGLKLAAALQAGGQGALRDGLEAARPTDKDEEWAVLNAIIEGLEPAPRHPRKGGRPKKTTPASVLTTSSGYSVRTERAGEGVVVHISGPHLHGDLVDSLARHIQNLLEKP